MTNEKNWLDGIEDIDIDKEIASKSNETDDLTWLETAHNEVPTINYLQEIENIEVGSKLLLNYYVNRGILEILKKQAKDTQLMQREMNLLWDFRKDFPDIKIEEVEETANE